MQCSRSQMFFKVGMRSVTLLKRDSSTDVLLLNLRNFENRVLCRIPTVTAS